MRLEAACEHLAILYRKAKLNEKPAIEIQLRKLMEKVFEMRQAEMERELKRLEAEYRRMKDTVERRRKYKDRVIDVHVLQLLGEGDIFEMW